MQRKSFAEMPCPIARSLEHVGEWWSILILRDAFRGVRRFEDFRESLGVAPNMLTRRLNSLVEAGLLRRELYCEHPPRHEYRLSERGKDFRPVLLALLAWGNRHFPPEGEGVMLVDTKSGATIDPILVDRHTGRPLVPGSFALAPNLAGGASPELSSKRAAGFQPALSHIGNGRTRSKEGPAGSRRSKEKPPHAAKPRRAPIPHPPRPPKER